MQGLGVVCNKEEGFGEDDFVVEFLGEVWAIYICICSFLFTILLGLKLCHVKQVSYIMLISTL
jgi:hypothetical protein